MFLIIENINSYQPLENETKHILEKINNFIIYFNLL